MDMASGYARRRVTDRIGERIRGQWVCASAGEWGMRLSRWEPEHVKIA